MAECLPTINAQPVPTQPEFGKNEEAMILTFLLDYPNQSKAFIADLTPDMFSLHEHKYVFVIIANMTADYGAPPSREQVYDTAVRDLKVDDKWQPVLELIKRKAKSFSEGMQARGMLRAFVEHKRIGRLYSDEVMQAYFSRDYQTVKEAMIEAQKPIFVTPDQESERCGLITCAELRKRVKNQDWIVTDVLVANKPMFIGGKKKVMKTGIACDLAVSIATGRDFLGYEHFRVSKPRKVAFFSAESGDDDINAYLTAIAKGKRLSYNDQQDDLTNLQLSFEPARLSSEDYLRRFETTLSEGGFEVVIVDPLYLTLLTGTEGDGTNLYRMGAILAPLIAACNRARTTFIGCHHFKKTAGDTLDLDDFTFAGIAEFARQSILIGRAAPYTDPEHNQLTMRLHGHRRGGLYDVSIAESKWQVRVQTAQEATIIKAKHKDQQLVDKLIAALEEIGGPALKQQLKDEMKTNGDTTGRAIQLALDAGEIVTDTTLHGRPLYRRTGT